VWARAGREVLQVVGNGPKRPRFECPECRAPRRLGEALGPLGLFQVAACSTCGVVVAVAGPQWAYSLSVALGWRPVRLWVQP
jgi:hypothetical protein